MKGYWGRIFGLMAVVSLSLVGLMTVYRSDMVDLSVGWPGVRSVVDSEAKVAVAVGIDESGVEQEFEVVGGDARVELVRRYLEFYHSPLEPYSQMIVDLSDSYGFEYFWIPAIGQQESNLCKKIPSDSYNCWGYGIHSKGTLRFASYEEALASFAEYLDREYFKKGYSTAEEMMRKYCPSSNGSWAYGVNQFIGELKTGSY